MRTKDRIITGAMKIIGICWNAVILWNKIVILTSIKKDKKSKFIIYLYNTEDTLLKTITPNFEYSNIENSDTILDYTGDQFAWIFQAGYNKHNHKNTWKI